MIHTRQFFVTGTVVLVASAAGFGQESTEGRGSGNAIEAAVEAFDLSEEQVESIREIRRHGPPRGQGRDEIDAWREEQSAKVQALLTEEQRTKVAELETARLTMQGFAGAATLGLVSPTSRWSEFGLGWWRGPHGGRDPRWSGRGALQRSFHHGPGARFRGLTPRSRGRFGFRGGRGGPARGRGRSGR